MKREVIFIAILSAILIFLVRFFEINFVTGEISLKFYMFLIGSIFLIIGIWFGLKFKKKETSIQIIEKEFEVISNPNDILTNRETELIIFLSKGLSNKEIAEKIFVSENTVKKHLNNIYTKLEVTRRTQAIAKAKQLGIISS